MKRLLLLFALLVASLAITIAAPAQTITTFDPPGAVGIVQPAVILDDGTITGFSLDAAVSPTGSCAPRKDTSPPSTLRMQAAASARRP